MSQIALHISNGIIDGPVSAAFGAVAIIGLAIAIARARADLDDRLAPMAGLVAAFIFAAQMLNFFVVPGVSGHLLGGALAAVLVGPWVGAACVATVLFIQALFADGGITALGLNVTNMALLATAAGYLVVVLLLRVLPRTRRGLVISVFVASVVSVSVAAQGFVLQYLLGGTTQFEDGIGGLVLAMAGTHALIGIGEGIIAAVTVATVARVRPDLVYALRRFPPRPAVAPATTVTVGGGA